ARSAARAGASWRRLRFGAWSAQLVQRRLFQMVDDSPFARDPVAAGADAEAIDAGVLDVEWARRLQGDTVQPAPDRIDHAAVREHHDIIAGQPLRQGLERIHDALLEGAQRFTVLYRRVGIAYVESARHVRTVFQRLPVRAFHHAETAFAQARVGSHGQAEVRRGDAGGFAGAHEVAAVDGIDPMTECRRLQRLRQHPRLLYAGLVQ